MLSSLSNSELQSNFSNDEFVLKTQHQIIKDFGTAGVEFLEEFHSTPLQLNQLIIEISSRLKEINSVNPSNFSQLLYQIDLPESLLSDLAKTDDFYQNLAEVVLKREAYKVYLRSKFSS